MSGKDEAAMRILETELKRAQKEGKSHEAYEIEMFLVEMQIYKVLLNSVLHFLALYKSTYNLPTLLLINNFSTGGLRKGFRLRMPET